MKDRCVEHLARKYEHTSSQNAGERLARLLSEAFHPLFVALPTYLVIAFASAPDSEYALLW